VPEANCSIGFKVTPKSQLRTGAVSPQGMSLLMTDLRFTNAIACYIHDTTADG
jgi:hypothetical protein